jgi:CheY-like chemotaxis protein
MSEETAKKNVLVVDDEEHIIDIIAKKLEKYNVTVMRAFDGKEALRKLDNQLFDLVITDIKMPKEDGISLLEHMRVPGEANSKTPVVAISGNLDKNKVQSLIAGKASGILAKPIDAEKFDQMISKLLGFSKVPSGQAKAEEAE